MGEKKSFLDSINWTSIAALLTVAGGLFIVNKPVSSERPKSTATTDFSIIGDQTVPSRLWEDPFGSAPPQNLDALAQLRSQVASTSARTTLLPVMIDGGPYSEDHEERIRSRVAIVSALGESGYVPDDSDHIGMIKLPWPTTADFDSGKMNGIFTTNVFTGQTNSLNFSFEWYHGRNLWEHSDVDPTQSVLVLWLDESQFADYPQTRLGLFLNDLAGNTNNTNPAFLSIKEVALIGPRTSDVLHRMLPRYDATYSPRDDINSIFRDPISNILHHVDVFCPTPSAMDAVLIDEDSAFPRASVQHYLVNSTNSWFKSFNNFCATDDQLAREAFDELKLRNIDLRKPKKNLVLISEWDTFYGRTLSLTYAAELAKFQGHCASDGEFIKNYRNSDTLWPANLYSYVYLRGLDGQSTRSTNETSASSSPSQPAFSLSDLKYGDLNLNKPEGEAQFDYLSRLGQRMQALEETLRHDNRGQIDAVGIAGSDVYDILVILQQLRPMFPNAVFFTTDLDARFAHPQVEEWTRNLLVFSSYGLELGTNLQRDVPPFRESDQAAEYVATLAALGGKNKDFANLTNLDSIPPRRFEIGRLRAYNLSVQTNNVGLLDPPPTAQQKTLPRGKTVFGLILILGLGIFLVICFCRTFQFLTLDRHSYESKSLWFLPEDVGCEQGLALISTQLKEKNKDCLVVWLLKTFCEENTSKDISKSPKTAKPRELQDFLDFLNQIVLLRAAIPEEVVANSQYVKEKTKNAFKQIHLEEQGQIDIFCLKRLQVRRGVFSDLFDKVLKKNDFAEKEQAHVSEYSRMAGHELYRLLGNWRRVMWICSVIFILALLFLFGVAYHDTHFVPTGEPFTFIGISVWPTEILRLISIFLSVTFLAYAYVSLRSGIFEMTRRYRLPLTNDRCDFKWRLQSTTAHHATIKAADLWKLYQQRGRFWQRIGRTWPWVVAYVIFCIGVSLIFQLPYSPVRGAASKFSDPFILCIAVIAFLFLTFWVIDAARLCRWAIEQLSEAPTRYPEECLCYYAAQHGMDEPKECSQEPEDLPVGKMEPSEEKAGMVKDEHLMRGEKDKEILAEWLDMQIIASLTDRIGRLVYYPFIVFSILLISRNNWWDHWTWPASITIIFSVNLFWAIYSIIILQNAAKRARKTCLENLQAKVALREREASPNPETNRLNIARRLLDDVKNIKKGAFASFWDNPIVGALLIPSGGTVILELLFNFVGQ